MIIVFREMIALLFFVQAGQETAIVEMPNTDIGAIQAPDQCKTTADRRRPLTCVK